MRRARYQATSVTEYAFPIALIAVGCIAALGLFGTSASDVLNWMANSIKSDSPVISKAIPVETESPQVAAAPVIAPEPKTLTSADIQALKKATEDYLPSFNETKQILDSTGANGATIELLTRLESLIPIWQSQNAITPDEADILRQLAQGGYQVAASQATLENAFYNNTTVTDGDKTYTLQQAAQMHGFKNVYDSLDESRGTIASLDASLASANLKPFMQLYAQASTSKAMANPVVNQEVTTLVKQIVTVDDSLSWAVDALSGKESGLVENKSRVSVLNSSMTTNFTDLSGSTLTGSASSVSTANSAQICQNSKSKNCN